MVRARGERWAYRVPVAKDADRQPYGQHGRRVDARLVVAVVVAVLLLAFVFQNTESVGLHWLFFDFSAPLWVMLAITVVVSLGIGWLLGHRSRSSKP